MKFSIGLAVLPLLQSCLATEVVPKYELIDPKELKARLNTTPAQYHHKERKAGTVYFCHGENWGPPCYAYHPALGYACSELAPELKGHVGSLFLEPGIICRAATYSTKTSSCQRGNIFAWPEAEKGWDDLLTSRKSYTGKYLGKEMTNFMCAECTNCVRNPTE